MYVRPSRLGACSGKPLPPLTPSLSLMLLSPLLLPLLLLLLLLSGPPLGLLPVMGVLHDCWAAVVADAAAVGGASCSV
jgi:hypothetical protein